MVENGEMRTRPPIRGLLAGMTVVLMGCTPPPEPTPIGTNQSFTGLVNGMADGALVTTVCPGPAGGFGQPAGGQSVAAIVDPSGDGNTGDNGAVFVEPNGTMQVIPLRSWGEAVEIPTDISVPCDGPGVMVFDPCFGFVGCRGDARADVIRVTFVNIAV